MKNRKIIIGFIIAFFCLLLIETFIYLTYSNTQKDEVKISFIVTGDNSATTLNPTITNSTSDVHNKAIKIILSKQP